MTNSSKDWEETEAALSALITTRRRADGANWADAHKMSMHYLERLGLVEALKNIRVLHIAGTKGKGSTAAFADSILQQCGYSVGLFTSPHLCDVRERCRVNGKLVSKEDFSRVFWQVHEILQPRSDEDPPAPGYFRFLTYLALKLFVEAQLDVIVLEVGLGGRLDSTNVIPVPVATAVTTLDYDHVELLGDTLAKIAREKAGIFRPNVPAYTCPQEVEAKESLQTVSNEVGCDLIEIAEDFSDFLGVAPGLTPKLGLHGSFQKKNATIAVAMCRDLDMHVAESKAPVAISDESLRLRASMRVRDLKDQKIPEDYRRGLERCQFAGRAQIAQVSVSALPNFPASDSGEPAACSTSASSQQASPEQHSHVSFYLDGAHTPASAKECAAWFYGASSDPDKPAGIRSSLAAAPSDARILIFNCMDTREPSQLLQPFSIPAAALDAFSTDLAQAPPAVGAGAPAPPPPPKTAATTAATATTAAGAAAAAAAAGAGSGCMFDHAMFVPADSKYYSVKPGGEDKRDVSWQLTSAQQWEGLLGGGVGGGGTPSPGSMCHANGAASDGVGSGVKDDLRVALGRGAVHTGQRYSVHSSLRHALACIRGRAVSSAGGSGRLHVLVTGSLHLVGDVLRHLGLAPV